MIKTPQEIRLVLPSKGTLRRKRIFDIVGAFFGLLVLSPIFLLAALAVRLSSPGEILFRQERMGLGGKPFVIYKFRTMRKDNAGLKITTSGDSRITPIGKFLRKSKLDELPQLINVLKGDMSFVGPRQKVKEYTDLYTEEERQVFLVRPGITGVASIRYRNENDILSASADPNWTYIHEIMPEKLRLDLTYISRAGVWQDICLIFETFAAIVKS